ncbi:MAG TPA: thioredoxin family protein [Tenuifilum sp.]|jgi:peroxiredoxin|uniref:thioredoxin family protein n=2 Tax=Tenuifilum sp. TaxID=2760880 RepID=UPI001B5625E7|nr:thioredoxin family protein [Bacteroidales bacterium]HOU75143.1 thioredoxin family protein [Tenuifilum sp.]
MKRLFLMLMATFMVAGLYAQGLKIGDKAPDFRLKNVDGKMVSLADYTQAKGFIVIFSCNHCPFVKAYEDRMIALHEKYASKGFPVIAINSNDPEVVPEDSFDKMVERAQQKKFPFVYLFDEGQKIYPLYGAARTPHVYILSKKANDLVVEYIGTIDDNYKDASAVKEKYVENAVDALLSGKKPAVTETKAVGCSIKVKK